MLLALDISWYNPIPGPKAPVKGSVDTVKNVLLSYGDVNTVRKRHQPFICRLQLL